MTHPITAADLVKAAALAEAAFPTAGAEPADFTLIAAESMLIGGDHCSGVGCWRLTFKSARLLPATPFDPLGAGGELFFTVDLETGSAVLTGRGE